MIKYKSLKRNKNNYEIYEYLVSGQCVIGCKSVKSLGKIGGVKINNEISV